QRRRVDEAHPVAQRGQQPDVQAGEPQAAHRRIRSAQGPHLLSTPRRPPMLRTFKIYRYDPEKDAKPYMQTIQVELDGHERMLLDALMKLKAVDPSISFRRSCREG